MADKYEKLTLDAKSRVLDEVLAAIAPPPKTTTDRPTPQPPTNPNREQ